MSRHAGLDDRINRRRHDAGVFTGEAVAHRCRSDGVVHQERYGR